LLAKTKMAAATNETAMDRRDVLRIRYFPL
jgi:hypothetical protein